jgi:hypothetical protein
MKNQVNRYLELDRLEANPQLARRIPPALARRYHVIPVGKDGERVTVAMADPNDSKARDAVMTTLGKSTCIVQADESAIDRLLDELWPENMDHRLHLLSWAPPDSIGAVVKTYAQTFSAMLDARHNEFETQMTGNAAYKALSEETELTSADMVIYRAPRQSLLKEIIGIAEENRLIDLLPVSSLLVYGFRWPIRNILLVIRNDDTDETSLSWTLNIAKPCSAYVTVLPITIPVPPVYADIQPDVPTLLTVDYPLGHKMLQVSRRLVDWEIEGTIRLRNELPNEQIRCEAHEGNHDLIVIAEEPQSLLKRRLIGELITPLLTWADRPLLIAKPRRVH